MISDLRRRLDLGAAVLAEQHAIASMHITTGATVFSIFAEACSNHFPPGFLFSGVRNDDAARTCSLIMRLDDYDRAVVDIGS